MMRLFKTRAMLWVCSGSALILALLITMACRPYFHAPLTLTFSAESNAPKELVVFYLLPGQTQAGAQQARQVHVAGSRTYTLHFPAAKIVGIGMIPGLGNATELRLWNIHFNGHRIRSADLLQSYHHNVTLSVRNHMLYCTNLNAGSYLALSGNKVDLSAMSSPRVLLTPLFTIFLLSFFSLLYVALLGRRFFLSESRMRWEDVVLLTVVGGLLIVPFLRLDTKSTVSEENRMLARFPDWAMLKNNDPNQSFTTGVEDYLRDRFGGRGVLIDLHARLHVLFDRRGTDQVLIGKDGFLFVTQVRSVENHRNLPVYNEKDFAATLRPLLELQKYCKERNKLFVLMICPDKHRIYGEFYPDYLNKVRPDDPFAFPEQFVRYLRKHTDIPVIYSREALLTLKKKTDTLLYLKNDTHWNLAGAYYGGYLELMKVIRTKYPDVPVVMPSGERSRTNESGDLTMMLPARLRELDRATIYKEPVFPAPSFKETRESEKFDATRHAVNPKGKYRLLMFGDSFTEGFRNNVFDTFAASSLYRRLPENSDKLRIDQADIIVLEQVERSFPVLQSMRFDSGSK